MHEVIQQVLATEAQAKLLVQEATTGANSILSEAHRHAEETWERTRQEVKAETDAILQATLQTAAQTKREQLARVAAEIESRYRLAPSTREQAIAAVIKCIIGA